MTAVRAVTCSMCQQQAAGVLWVVRRNGVIVRQFVVVQCPRCDVPEYQKHKGAQ